MTEILVQSLDEEGAVVQPILQSTGSIQMQGFAAAGTPEPASRPPNGAGDHYHFESEWEKSGRSRASSKVSVPTSLRSEPDLDTIMPLPGSSSAFNKRGRGGYQRVPGEGSDSDSEGSGSASSPYSPAIASFTTVEHPMMGHSIFGDDLTAKALETCKKTVLHPYLAFLKVIGWRRFHPKRYDLRTPAWLTAVNIIWPTFVCLLLVASCVTQISTCFRRDRVRPLAPVMDNSSNESYYRVRCDQHLATTFLIPDILLITSFAYGLYIFRWVQTEQLSTLTEAVFLGHITKHGKYTHKRLTRSLQLLMALGIFWILFSLLASVGRAYSLHLVDRNTKIKWLPTTSEADYAIRWVFVTVTVIGFVLLDIAYTAVVVNYSIQCQLLIYLLRSISERTRAKEWEIDVAIKEIRNSREFLTQLNSHLARAISLLLFIFLTASVNAIYGLQVDYNSSATSAHLASLMGVLTAIQWLSILALPLIQAARVTQSCAYLKKTATETRSRPYSYKDTSQLDLDSMVIYTSGLNMSAKLISIPVSPGVVAGTFFASGLVLFLVFQFRDYPWAEWL